MILRNFRILWSTTTKRRTSTKSQENLVIVEKDENITLIGINREDSRNSIDTATANQLKEALNAFEEDETSPVGVLYGVGGTFSAGLDVKELDKQLEEKNLNYLLNQDGSVGPTRRHLRKTVICGINGFCVGAGLELALLCDLRVMEDTAILGFFNRHLGVPISDGGTVRLANTIGYSRALDIITTGRRVHAKEALEIGLINRIVSTGTALGQAVNVAFSIAKFTQAALQHDRNSLYNNVYGRRTFRETIQDEIMLTSKEILTEMNHGVRKFVQSERKGSKVDSFQIKEKDIPDWEKEEIQRELNYAKSKS